MKTYIVKSGDINCRVKALSGQTALVIAINNNPDAKLGQIMSYKAWGDNWLQEQFVSTERVLKDMGINVQ